MNLTGPDLNLIEHLWRELEQKLSQAFSSNISDLINALLEERSKIPINTLLNLVESLARRVEAVLPAKGRPPSY